MSERSDAPGTRRGTSRTSRVRRSRSPTAHMAVRNETQRAIRRPGVAALSVSEGITNCGAGPGLGPTANVNAPLTGWPSAEITRQ